MEDIPADAFVPPHCPYPDCAVHPPGTMPFSWKRAGSHRRKHPPCVVPRFLCLTCRRTFSQMTFAVTYRLKRPELLEPVAAGLVASAPHRRLAHSLHCAPSTITRLAARLGRHALLVHQLLLRALARQPLQEPVVFDDLETFTGAQFFPLAIGTAVGQTSGLVLDLDQAPHARGGALNPYERAERARLYARFGRPPRGARRLAFERILARLLALARGNTLELVTDDHPVYHHVVAGHPDTSRIVHRRYSNPPRGPKRAPRRTAARHRDRALFEVDQLHRLVRHVSAAHRRETIAFGRRVAAVMERAFLFAVWRNLVKPRSERRPGRGSSAMQADLTTHCWTWREVFRGRLFPSLVPLPDSWRAIYDHTVPTPGAPPPRVP